MNEMQLLTLLVVLVAGSLVAVWAGIRRGKAKRRSTRQDALRQNLRLKVLYDEAKIDRLIEFERDELKRKGRSEETVEALMGRAVARWERDNAGTAPLY